MGKDETCPLCDYMGSPEDVRMHTQSCITQSVEYHEKMRDWRKVRKGKASVMTLDGVELRFHVRECDNRVAIVLTQPGWAAASGNDCWYVAVEDLRSTGRMSEGQDVKRWIHRDGSVWPGGVSKAQAMEIAEKFYIRESERENR